MLEKRLLTKLYKILTKLGTLFNEFYITMDGKIVTNDIDKPYYILVEDEYMELFNTIFGEYEIIFIPDFRAFKKCIKELELSYKAKKASANMSDEEMETMAVQDEDSVPPMERLPYLYKKLEEKHELEEIKKILAERADMVLKAETWKVFQFSSDPSVNEELLTMMFDQNDYVRFSPTDRTDSPDIIMTKALIPLVTMKNIGDLYYNTRQITEEVSLLTFDFFFEMFQLYSFHHYIPINAD